MFHFLSNFSFRHHKRKYIAENTLIKPNTTVPQQYQKESLDRSHGYGMPNYKLIRNRRNSKHFII